MPLRNVATTFTIEQQRLEINALAGDVNNIATGVTNVGTAATANALAAGATGADLTLSGTLTVNGTQTILNTETLQVEDKEIVIGNVSSPTDATAHGGGWKLKGANNKTITYNQTGDKWVSNKDFEAPAFYGDGSNLTGVGATLADAGNANANSTILFSSNATGSGQTLSTDGGLLYNAAEDALKVNGTIITSSGIIGAGASCTVAAANHSSTCSITVSDDVQVTGDINLSEGKKTIFNSNSGTGAYIKHQSGHLEIKNETGNLYWDNTGQIRIRTGASYTEALSITGGQDVQIPNGYLQIDPTDHDKLKLKVPTGSSDDWAYMTFWGEDGNRNAYIGTNAAGDVKVSRDGGCNLEMGANAVFNANVSDSKGDLRSIPDNVQSSSSNYDLVASDAGKCIIASGNVTFNAGIFSGGDAVTIINNTNSDITIVQGNTVLYWTADGTNASRTLGTRGIASIYFTHNTTGYISGAQLS